MLCDPVTYQCIYHILDGLRMGLSSFSGTSRVSVIYAMEPEDPLHVYDPQGLLRDHEPPLREFYRDSGSWRLSFPQVRTTRSFETISEDIQLVGMISFAAKSPTMFYQRWFTEHHPDMCCTGPSVEWMENAAWLLSQHCGDANVSLAETSGHVLQQWALHAVRNFIVDERSKVLGLDTHLRIYPVLESVLAISRTLEEGKAARGDLAFVEPKFLPDVRFLARFPDMEPPLLTNTKHVRKLLQTAEDPDHMLVSDGMCVLGIATHPLPPSSIKATFFGGPGFLHLDDNCICSFSDGGYRSSNRRAKLVQLEESLLDTDLDSFARHHMFQVISRLVHSAQRRKHGCTLVVDLNSRPVKIPGQHLVDPLDLLDPAQLSLTKSLSQVDGALHLGADLKLHGFACLLDGRAVAVESRSRGARFNSALRFSSEHEKILVVVVSEDRGVSIIQHGMEMTAVCDWKPFYACLTPPPTLEDWLKS
ncbi:MAG: DNA-binding protein [Desulfovibrio sp.]|nr:MAG: DNA-binding protein [Desulfovibrio sp.]